MQSYNNDEAVYLRLACKTSAIRSSAFLVQFGTLRAIMRASRHLAIYGGSMPVASDSTPIAKPSHLSACLQM